MYHLSICQLPIYHLSIYYTGTCLSFIYIPINLTSTYHLSVCCLLSIIHLASIFPSSINLSTYLSSIYNLSRGHWLCHSHPFLGGRRDTQHQRVLRSFRQKAAQWAEAEWEVAVIPFCWGLAYLPCFSNHVPRFACKVGEECEAEDPAIGVWELENKSDPFQTQIFHMRLVSKGILG